MNRLRDVLLLILWYLLMGAVVAVYAYVAMLILFRLFGPVNAVESGVYSLSGG